MSFDRWVKYDEIQNASNVSIPPRNMGSSSWGTKIKTVVRINSLFTKRQP